MLLAAASNQPDPRPSCCIACRASRASQALWEVLEPRVLEVFLRPLFEGWRCCCRTVEPWTGWTWPRPAASEPSNNPVSLVRAKPCKAATKRWPRVKLTRIEKISIPTIRKCWRRLFSFPYNKIAGDTKSISNLFLHLAGHWKESYSLPTGNFRSSKELAVAMA